MSRIEPDTDATLNELASAVSVATAGSEREAAAPCVPSVPQIQPARPIGSSRRSRRTVVLLVIVFTAVVSFVVGVRRGDHSANRVQSAVVRTPSDPSQGGSALQLAVYINDELMPGQRPEVVLPWKSAYEAILEQDYPAAVGFLAGPGDFWLRNVPAGRCKAALQRLADLLTGRIAPPDGVDYHAMGVQELMSYIEDYLLPSQSGQIVYRWRFPGSGSGVRECVGKGLCEQAAARLTACLQESPSPECQKAMQALRRKLSP